MPADCTLTPIPAGEEVSSLSAILLDEDYYAWIRQGDRTVDDVHIVGAAYLIPLKMKAWLDLSMRAARGEHIDSRTLRKHPNDVFRLYTILSLDPLSSVPEGIKQDIDEFIQKIEREEIDFKNLGLGNLTLSEVLSDLRVIYDVGNQVSR